MPKPVVKITVREQDADEIGSTVTCDISSVDNSWHGLKELERAGFFKKLYELYRNTNGTFKILPGDSFLNRTWSIGKTLTPNPKLYSFEKPRDKKFLKEQGQLKYIDIRFDKTKTVQELKDLFEQMGFTAIITDKFGLKEIKPTTTLLDYAAQAQEAWYQKIEAEGDAINKVRKDAERGEVPNIDTYIRTNPDFFRHGKDKEPDWAKESAKRLTKTNRDAKGFDLLLRGRDAIEHAISDAITRMETLDRNGNLERCPVTLEPFEGHNKVILILSRQGDGTLQASFVQRETREGRKATDNLPYIKQLRKNPENNNPIVAIETGTLSELKDKYRKTMPKFRPL